MTEVSPLSVGNYFETPEGYLKSPIVFNLVYTVLSSMYLLILNSIDTVRGEQF